MKRGLALVATLAMALCAAAPAGAATYALIVSGLGGDADFEHRFSEWNTKLTTAAREFTGDPARVTSLSGAGATAAAMEKALAELARKLQREDTVLVVLIGHGSFAGDEYRYNLPGPDATGPQLKQWLDRLPAERQFVVNATSSSGAVAESWRKPGRVLLTATRAGGERNATRFAQYLIEALSSDRADRDKDQTVTAAEVFAYANQAVADSFKADAAIATEHPRMEGTDPQRLVVARFGRAARYADDPQLRALQARASALELELNSVKARKTGMPEDAYYDALEPVLVRMAHLGTEVEARERQLGIAQPGEAQ